MVNPQPLAIKLEVRLENLEMEDLGEGCFKLAFEGVNVPINLELKVAPFTVTYNRKHNDVDGHYMELGSTIKKGSKSGCDSSSGSGSGIGHSDQVGLQGIEGGGSLGKIYSDMTGAGQRHDEVGLQGIEGSGSLPAAAAAAGSGDNTSSSSLGKPDDGKASGGVCEPGVDDKGSGVLGSLGSGLFVPYLGGVRENMFRNIYSKTTYEMEDFMNYDESGSAEAPIEVQESQIPEEYDGDSQLP